MRKTPPPPNPDAYVASLSGWQRTLVSNLRASVLANRHLTEGIKWGNLVYFSNGPVLVIRAENHRVLFGFWRGQKLRGLDQRLRPGGKYDMATMELREGDEVDSSTVERLTEAAVALNTALGDPTKV
jgi:hypothetical protein